MTPELVVDKDAFCSLSRECETIFDIEKRLPDFVFRRPFDSYCAFEYAYVYRAEFGLFLSKLAALFEDESIHYMLLDPPSGDSYFRRTAFWGGVSFTPSRSVAERYVPVMHREGNVRRLLTSANVGVFWGSSLKWGIHCDRISWEMAVVAVRKDIDVPAISGFRCMDAEALSNYMKSLYHWKLSTASEFMTRFLVNYPI